MKELYDALDRMMDGFEPTGRENDELSFKSDRDNDFDASARLRHDFEMSDSADFCYADMIHQMVGHDLEDLIINGDLEATSDPLLKALHGEVKRGQRAVDIDIRQAVIHTVRHEDRKTTEYTLWPLLAVKFADGEPHELSFEQNIIHLGK